MNNEKLGEEKINYYVSKLEEADAKVARVKEKQEEELKQKHIADLLKRIDKRENVERITRIGEFEKEAITEKIKLDSIRAEQLRFLKKFLSI